MLFGEERTLRITNAYDIYDESFIRLRDYYYCIGDLGGIDGAFTVDCFSKTHCAAMDELTYFLDLEDN